MQIGRTSTIKNVFYGLSSWIVPIAFGFLVTPVIVRSLGAHEYGIYALVLGFVAYSFNFSIGRAITKYVAEYRVSGEIDAIRDVISSTFALNVVVGIIGLTATLSLSSWFVTSVFQIEEESHGQTVSALNVSAFVIFFLMLAQVFHAVIQGVHRFDVFAKIQNATSLVMLTGNLLLVMNGYRLLALLYWNLVVTALSCALAFFCAKSLLPDFGLFGLPNVETVKRIIRYSAAVVGYQITANILLLSERGWITAKLGSESLAYYVVPMTLAVYIHGFVASLMLVVFPLASELDRDRKRLLKLYKKATKIGAIVAVYLAVTLAVLSHPILTLWIGPDFGDRSGSLLIVHAAAFGFTAILTVTFQMAEGLGFPSFNFWMLLAAFIVFVPLMVLLSPEMGNMGVAIARLAAFSLLFFGIGYMERWAFGAVQIRFWISLAGGLIVAATVAGCTEWLLEMYLPIGWATLAMTMLCGGIAYCIVLWTTGTIGNEEWELINQVKRSVRK